MQIGEILKEARMERGLTLSQVAKELLIQEKYLQALEDGNYEIIPGEAYQRAFFRAYAEFLGLSSYIDDLTHPRAFAKEDDEQSMDDVFGGTWDASRWLRMLSKIALIVIIIFAIVSGVKALNAPKKIPTQPEFTESTQSLSVIPESASRSWNWPDPENIANPTASLTENEHKLHLRALGECWVKVET
ncbi:MAG TPA: helix-turn-helix domain-containing protein, partial [Firmicutes bacterium]|nr:helix-turn-helix domain-containing protein [Bacillota bacterium]